MAERILVVEDTESLREVLCTVLESEGFQVVGTGSAEEAISHLGQHEFDLVISDLRLPNLSGIEVVKRAREALPAPPVIVMTAYGSIAIAVEAMKLGAADFLVKPFEPTLLHDTIRNVINHRRVIHREGIISDGTLDDRVFLTQARACEHVLLQARKVAPLSSPVIVSGESGTGKELLARYIHQHSLRADAPFVAVNCASMPSELLESEFFGHEAGAFTGATEQRRGLFEAANGGTLFLDEIGNMPLNLQVKLLRVLQESEVRRIGSTKITKVDTRVICATNADLEHEMKCGRFRDDLYYRLSVVVLEVPPLRERPEDVELLATFFIKKFSQRFQIDEPHLTEDGLEWMLQYPWPGNVRELENVMQRIVLFGGSDIGAATFDAQLDEVGSVSSDSLRSLPEVASQAVRDAETSAIRRALAETHGNKLRAAKLLGVSYKTLLNKVKEYGLALH